MFYDFVYLAKGFRMRPKVRSTLIKWFSTAVRQDVNSLKSSVVVQDLEFAMKRA